MDAYYELGAIEEGILQETSDYFNPKEDRSFDDTNVDEDWRYDR